MATKNTLLLVSMVMLLSACGGGSDTDSEQKVSPPTIPQITPTPSNTINLSGSKAETNATETKVAGKPTTDRGLIDSVAANARASISISNLAEVIEGNITFELAASDEDGISSLSLVIPSVNKNITLCNQACGTNFERSVIGFSPNYYGVTPGDLRLEIWITDKLNNQILAGAAAVRWQPYQIIGTTAQRDLQSINLSWQANDNLNRYNVYVATEAGITPSNISQLENGQQYLGLSGTTFSFANLFVDKSYQVLITGVDGGGESGFAEPLNIPPAGGELNFAPEATNDQFQIDEDTSLQGNILSNDSDQYLGELSANTTPIVLPQHGIVEIAKNGQFIYTPRANFNGIDAFSYQVINQLGMTDTALVEIIINAVNDAPTALDNHYNITQDGSLSVSAPGLLVNDSDIDSTSLSVDPVAVTQPTKGQLTLNTDGSFDYLGDANMQGVDSFQYRIFDASGAQAIANVTIAGSAENNAPMATNDNFSLNEDTTLIVSADSGLLANDADPDNDNFTLDESFLISPNHGQLLLASDGSFSYIPDANYFGIDKFQYQIIDSFGATATATATLTINSVADSPGAQNDIYQFQYNQRLDVSATDGLLSNDVNVEVGKLSVNTTPVENVKSGTLTLNNDGSFSYQPSANALDVDSFSYSVFNQQGLSATAQVILSKAGSNTPARAVDDQYSLAEDSIATQFDVLENDIDVDGDAIAITSISTVNGTARVVNNKIEFTPPANFFGEAQVTYSISDGLTNNPPTSATAIATITVLAINDTPIAVADAMSIVEDSPPILVDVLANDSDIDGDNLTIISTSTNLGLVTIVDNKIQYTPAINSNGVALIPYTITDGNGATATTNLVVNISATNDAPTVNPDTITLIEDSPATLVDVLDNDNDVDGDALTITTVNANSGTAAVVNNQIEYTPAANDNGTAVVSYTVSDGTATAASNLTVTITAVNDAPLASADTATINEDQISSIDVLANDTDIDGDALTITTVSASNGNAAVVNNKIEYTPAANDNGTAVVSYTISDGTATAASNLTVTITAVNDAPIANADTATLLEDALATNIDVLSNDTDVDGDTLSITAASATSGSVSFSGSDVIYTPASNFNGTATVNYTLSDGTNTAAGELTITVTPVNDAPIANADTATLLEDALATNIDVLSNDTDVDGDTLSITAASATSGSVSFSGSDVIYTPASDFNGTDTVIYTLSDGTDTAAGELTITVTPVNDAPIANADTFTILEDALATSIDVLANDTDVDADTLTITTVNASVGSVAVVSDKIEYTAAADDNGTAVVDYTISDGNLTASSTLTITINPVNDAPSALDQNFAIGETATHGDTIGTLVASDIENHTLSFSLSSGDIGLFTLNSATGLLTANGVSPFDYETSTEHTISIDITDDGTPTATTTITVTVTILDEVDPLEPVEDSSFGRPVTGQLELADVFSDGEFKDSIVLNSNLYFVGYTSNVDKDIIITSYTSTGAVNTTFDSDGIKVFDFNQDEEATAIVSGNGDLFVAFSSSNGTNTEACLMKISTTGIVSNNSGDANTGIRCTTLTEAAVINDLEFTDNKIQAVGHYDDGFDKDSLWLKYDAVTLAFEDSPKIVDVSGASRDDEAFAINNFGNSDLMVVGSVSSLLSGKNSVIRHLQPNGDDKGDFNSGSPLLLDLSADGLDDELLVIGGVDAPNFTAYLGGYKRRSNSEKEAILTAVDNLGNIQLSIGNNGVETYNIDSDSDESDGGDTLTGIEYEPINNQLILSGSTGVEATDIDQNIRMYSARILMGTAELDDSYANSGINIVSTVLGDQIANSLSIDENDTLWLAGKLNDASNEPFITAVNGQQNLFTDFAQQGYASLNSLSIVANNQSMNVLQLTTGAHAGKFILASRAEYAANNKLVLTRFTANGLVDKSFSLDGSKALNINISADDFKLLELTDGSIVIAGTKINSGDKAGFIAKIDQNGLYDYSFATNGIYSTAAVLGTDITFLDVARDDNDNMVAVGSTTTLGFTRSFATMIKDGGSLEGSFGIGGEFIGNINEIFESLYIDTNEDIFVGGKLVSSNESQLLMLKWNSDADQEFRYLDSRSVPDVTNRAAKILADPLANLYLIGNEGTTPNQAVIIKLSSAGNKDLSFATSGMGLYSLAANGDSTVADAALDSAGNLVLTGMSNSQGVLARVLANGSLDTSFGPSSLGYYQDTQCSNTQQFTSMLLPSNTQVIVSSTCFDGTSKNVSLSKFNFYADGVEP
jgi:large repetitive protein